MSKEIGSQLKRLRKSKGMTQAEASTRLGMTRSTISNYEIGRRTPVLSDLKALVELYGEGLDIFGVSKTDKVFDLLVRAKQFFQDEDISRETKEEVFIEVTKMYINLKKAEKIDSKDKTITKGA